MPAAFSSDRMFPVTSLIPSLVPIPSSEPLVQRDDEVLGGGRRADLHVVVGSGVDTVVDQHLGVAADSIVHAIERAAGGKAVSHGPGAEVNVERRQSAFGTRPTVTSNGTYSTRSYSPSRIAATTSRPISRQRPRRSS